MGIAFTIARPSIIITLYFGEVSVIPVKPFLVNSGSCIISVAYIYWLFVLLETVLVDFPWLECVRPVINYLLGTKDGGVFSLCHKPIWTAPSDANRDRGITLNSIVANAFLQSKLWSTY